MLRRFGWLLALPSVSGHGALTTPVTRRGNTGYENDPVGLNTEAFVCRHATRNAAVPYHEVTAGEETPLTWDFSAAHVGDCAVFVSYDVDAPLATQKYFKIANLPKCRDQNRAPVAIKMPDWLPAGNAILRWDWYALHQHPGVEFYSQCIDITITAKAGSTVAAESITTYTIIGNDPPVYPASRTPGAYRNPFGNGKELTDPGFFMTGPACADTNSLDNNCALTKDNGLGGDLGGGGGDGGGGGTPPPSGGDDETGPPVCVPIEYTVQAGDDLGGIADAYPDQGVDGMQICAENVLADCNQIEVGQVLVIPCDNKLMQSTGGGGGGGGENAGLIVGVVFAILIAGALIAIAIYKMKPDSVPPPPPLPGSPGNAKTIDVAMEMPSCSSAQAQRPSIGGRPSVDRRPSI